MTKVRVIPARVKHFANPHLILDVVWMSEWVNPMHGSSPAVCRIDDSWYGGEIDNEGKYLYYVNLYDDESTARSYAESLIYGE